MADSQRKINEWDLTSTNLNRISQRKYEVAVLPVGAIEAHNRHLPEGQDVMHTTYVAQRSCKLAWEKCESVICLPILPYGVDCNQMAYPLAITVSQRTLDEMVREIVASLKSHGISKIVIVNGHGGNEFRPLIRQIQSDVNVHVFLCDWWKIGHDKYDEILSAFNDIGTDKLIILALGPTATVLAYDLCRSGYQAIDIGQIDSDYEKFLRKDVKLNIPVKFKEVDGDKNRKRKKFHQLQDPEYKKQTIKIIT